MLQPGDKIKFRIKALTGCGVTVNSNIRLFEVTSHAGHFTRRIYCEGNRQLPLKNFRLPLQIKQAQLLQKKQAVHFRCSPTQSKYCRYQRKVGAFIIWFGEDRLGGAKIGYLDSLVQLHIIGKVGSKYKVQLRHRNGLY